MNRCRQRRLSASVISRALFDVRMTNGRMRGAQRAELGHRDLEVGEHLEQEGLELGVGAVDLVDEQHAALGRADGAQQRTRQEEALGEERVLLRRQLVDRLGQRASRRR